MLKDITDRKRAEEKYRTLVSNVQEGVFISTPPGRFLDFNDAFQRICGHSTRESLLALDIPSLYVNPQDRERLKRLLEDHGSVADFEFELRTADGEIRSVTESSIAVRDASGGVTAYQGFLLDITERKRAEHEIRRRNRELLVLNSISKTLTESLDLEPVDAFRVPGLLDLTGLFQIHGLPGYAHLRDPAHLPQPVPDFLQAANLWAAIRARVVALFVRRWRRRNPPDFRGRSSFGICEKLSTDENTARVAPSHQSRPRDVSFRARTAVAGRIS